MQAFLWRHLVPAKELKALVFDPSYQLPPKRIAPVRPPSPAVTTVPVSAPINAATNLVAGTNTIAGTNAVVAASTNAAEKPKFTRQQIAGRLRQLKLLFEEGLLTDDFYCEKVAECEAGQ
jgi:hypothetical protein